MLLPSVFLFCHSAPVACIFPCKKSWMPREKELSRLVSSVVLLADPSGVELKAIEVNGKISDLLRLNQVFALLINFPGSDCGELSTQLVVSKLTFLFQRYILSFTAIRGFALRQGSKWLKYAQALTFGW